MILNPPAVPNPSSGGAPSTLTSPSLISSCSRRCKVDRQGVARESRRQPLVEFIEHHVHGAEIRGVGIEQDRLAGDGHRVADAGRVQRDLLDARITSSVRPTEAESGSCRLTSRYPLSCVGMKPLGVSEKLV